MRGITQIRRLSVSLVLFLVLTGLVHAANGSGWVLELLSPANNTTYDAGSTIGAYSGRYSWQTSDDAIDNVQMFTLTVSDNPDQGTQVSSNYANHTPDGTRKATFNSQNVTPALTAPTAKSKDFYIVAVPENAAQGRYYPNGMSNPPYLVSHSCKTSN